jgi:hypothetical protein
VVKTFNGADTLTTDPFQTSDNWEVRWDSAAPLNIRLLSSDGAVVAGMSGTGTGSFYQPKGGSFYLQVNPTDRTGPWHVRVVELAAVATITPPPLNFVPRPVTPPSTNDAPTNPAMPSTNFAPITFGAPNPAASIPDRLTPAQARAIVVIKGDTGEGTGFFVKTADGLVVVTNQHVAAANPNLKILTSSGKPVQILSIKGASDRDLIMFAVQDDHDSYLDLCADVEHTVTTGDHVLTPGNGEGGEVVLTTAGTVLGIGPDKIEVTNPVYHGNSGGPIIHLDSGQVVGVITEATKIRMTNEVDQASFANSNSAISGTMRYFGLRVDSVPKWEPYDWSRFLQETTFLKQFRLASRCLDSLLNGARYERAKLTSTDPNEGMPNSSFYRQDESLGESFDQFKQASLDGDKSERLDQQREFLMDLQGFAAKDMDAIQNPANFYSFDHLRAKQEIAYRNALKAELDSMGDKISDLGH